MPGRVACMGQVTGVVCRYGHDERSYGVRGAIWRKRSIDLFRAERPLKILSARQAE